MPPRVGSGTGGSAPPPVQSDPQDKPEGFGAVSGKNYIPQPDGADTSPVKKSLRSRKMHATTPELSLKETAPAHHLSQETLKGVSDDIKQEWQSAGPRSPHQKKGFWFGGLGSAGGLALALGCSAIPVVGPILLGIGASMYVMGLMAHTYAYYQEESLPAPASGAAQPNSQGQERDSAPLAAGESDGEKPESVDYSDKSHEPVPPQVPPAPVQPPMMPPPMGQPPMMPSAMPPMMSPMMMPPPFVHNAPGLMGDIQGYIQGGGKPWGEEAIQKARELASQHLTPRPAGPTTWPEALDQVRELMKAQPAPVFNINNSSNNSSNNSIDTSQSGNQGRDAVATRSMAGAAAPAGAGGGLSANVKTMIEKAVDDDKARTALTEALEQEVILDSLPLPPPPDAMQAGIDPDAPLRQGSASRTAPIMPVLRPGGEAKGYGSGQRVIPDALSLPDYPGELKSSSSIAEDGLDNPYEEEINKKISVDLDAIRRNIKSCVLFGKIKENYHLGNNNPGSSDGQGLITKNGDYYKDSISPFMINLVDRVIYRAIKNDEAGAMGVNELCNGMIKEIDDVNAGYPGAVDKGQELKVMYKHLVAVAGVEVSSKKKVGLEQCKEQDWFKAGFPGHDTSANPDNNPVVQPPSFFFPDFFK